MSIVEYRIFGTVWYYFGNERVFATDQKTYRMPITDQVLIALRQRIEKGVTIYVVAKATGISHSIIARFERGERKQIRSETIDRLCEYLGLQLTPIAGHQAQPAATGKPASNAGRGAGQGSDGRGGKGTGARSSGRPAKKPSPPKIAEAGEVPKPAKGKRKATGA